MANILVVDDDPAICNTLQMALEMEDHVVTCTTEAHKLPNLLKSQPDVVFLDVWMPRITGLECISLIRRAAPESKVIIITGLNDYQITDLLHEQGIDGFLAKPIHITRLYETLASVLASEPPNLNNS